MEKTEMTEKLTQRAKELKEELINIEAQFNVKKEEFLKVQGAIEALQALAE
jgi:biopolymer transport protein ExbD